MPDPGRAKGGRFPSHLLYYLQGDKKKGGSSWKKSKHKDKKPLFGAVFSKLRK